MRSGIVHFDQIVEEISDYTGIENLRPLYPRIRRFVFKVEQDIGPGSLMVVKKKNFTKNDGFYDGKRLILPQDFLSEWSHGALSNGSIFGNVFELYENGPDEIEFKYLGLLVDAQGNPFTTYNRLETVAKYAQYRLYGNRYFMGKGSQQQYLLYKQEYDNSVMEARGNDVFPTEEEFNELGTILRGGTFEALTDCGMKTIYIPTIEDTTQPVPDPTCVVDMEGVVYGQAFVFGEITFRQTLYASGQANGSALVTGRLRTATLPDMALQGSSSGVASVTGQLLNSTPVVQCNESFQYSGSQGTFEFILELGQGIGQCGIEASAYSIPDRFRIEYNGVPVADSGFIGNDSASYRTQLADLGYEEHEINLGTGSTNVPVLFYKGSSSPTFARVFVDAPLGGTAWRVQGVCPQTTAGGTSSVSGILTDGS